ncbi:hypothetical protein V1638_05270 [Pseudarthrobacter sp. J64]|uniref:hypothetical protein n=1 Tax=Pseudarthrobacter sp. J64 TaxID=3116485 RepID=UPI002E7FD898|nr:hypothetical protein [Pseudarthrobacter sp. J64]MEE2568805.1 hypothetical protein [Pseudarthrobacter sp. J64]
MTLHIESPLGFTADFPENTQVLEESSGGPGTEQYGLPGDVLVTVFKDNGSVNGAPQITGWAHLMSDFYLKGRAGHKISEGELNLPGKDSYAVMVGYDSPVGSAQIAAPVGIWEQGKFLGAVVIWPVVNPEIEPRVDLLKDIVGAISLN